MSSVPNLDQLRTVPYLNLSPGHQLPFDIYLRLSSSGRVIRYRRKDSSIDGYRLDDLNARQACFLISRDHYDLFVQHAGREILRLLTDESGGAELPGAARAMLSNVLHQTEHRDTIEIMDNLGDLTKKILNEIALRNEERTAALHAFLQLSSSGRFDLLQHPVNCASLTLFLLFAMEVKDQRILLEAGLASLVHDLGLAKVSPLVAEEAHRGVLDAASIKALRHHPRATLEILKSRKMKISKLMEVMILQHHEDRTGGGYPAGLKGDEVHLLAQVLHVADEIDGVVGHSGGGSVLFENVRGRILLYEEKKMFSEELIQVLKSCFF